MLLVVKRKVPRAPGTSRVDLDGVGRLNSAAGGRVEDLQALSWRRRAAPGERAARFEGGPRACRLVRVIGNSRELRRFAGF